MYPRFSLTILVAGERCNVRGEYFERGSTSELKNSHGLPNVRQRILRNIWRILQSPMVNEQPVYHSKKYPYLPPQLVNGISEGEDSGA